MKYLGGFNLFMAGYFMGRVYESLSVGETVSEDLIPLISMLIFNTAVGVWVLGRCK